MERQTTIGKRSSALGRRTVRFKWLARFVGDEFGSMVGEVELGSEISFSKEPFHTPTFDHQRTLDVRTAIAESLGLEAASWRGSSRLVGLGCWWRSAVLCGVVLGVRCQ
jgi:hypothetical protein